MRKPQTGIKLQLVVLRLHVAAQGIERFVVLFLFQVRQLVHHDHAQKRFRRVLEQAANARAKRFMRITKPEVMVNIAIWIAVAVASAIILSFCYEFFTK